MSEWIPAGDWETIVANVPIVSVDLLVRYDGGLLLGKRTNEPAKDRWFTPGGRVQKGDVDGEIQPDDQHAELRVFQPAPDPLHEHLRAYLKASTTLDGWL